VLSQGIGVTALEHYELLREKYRTKILKYLKDECGVAFEKSGKRYWVSCPFHDPDVHPSFNMWGSEGYIHTFCFGKCGEREGHYSVFDIIMKSKNCNIHQAVNQLASYLGIQETVTVTKLKKARSTSTDVDTKTLEQQDAEAVTQSPELMRTLKQVAERYSRYLLAECPDGDVLAYLNKRGIDEEAIVTHGIGYCPDYESVYQGRLIVDSEGLNSFDLLETGVITLLDNADYPRLKEIRRPKTTWRDSYGDFFAGRITIPIYDSEGNVRNIQGRIATGENLNIAEKYRPASYINLPNAPKDTLLYGLQSNAENIRKHKTVVLVEGTLDYIALYKNFQHDPIVVATLTNNLSIEQYAELSALGVERYIVAYDSDKGGWKGFKNIIKAYDERFHRVAFPRHADPSDVYAKLRNAINTGATGELLDKGPGATLLTPRSPVTDISPPKVDYYYDAAKLMDLILETKREGESAPKKCQRIRKYLMSDKLVSLDLENGLPKGYISIPRMCAYRIHDTDYEGNALLLYLYIIIRQQQGKVFVELTDGELAKIFGVSVRTVASYRKYLKDKGLLNFFERGTDKRKLKYSVKYFPPAKKMVHDYVREKKRKESLQK
jgi:DNA primase catalytic core